MYLKYESKFKFNVEYLCVKEEWWSIILFGRIKPHAAMMLVQIHGYIDTDYRR